MNSFLDRKEIQDIGFCNVGEEVFISRFARFYGANRITIGNRVRIDDFCVLSAGAGGITIGNFVHVAVFCSIQGDGRITIEDFVGLSSRVSIYSSNDDYLGEFLTNPMIPAQFSGVTVGPVILRKHALIGSGAVILPGVTLHEGSVVGALSLVSEDCEEFAIYRGAPAKKFLKRSKNLLKLERELLEGGFFNKAVPF